MGAGRAFHCVPSRFKFRVNVSSRGRKITMPRKVGQRVRVHVQGPSREAGVPEGVERKLFELCNTIAISPEGLPGRIACT